MRNLKQKDFSLKKLIILTAVIAFSAAAADGFPQTETYLKNRIMVEGLYIRNIGNFGEIWANASGAYIGYSIAYPEHNLLMIRTGFINNSLRDGIDYEDAKLIIIPIEAGGRYYFFENRFMPFVQFMPGFNIVFENTNLEGEKINRTLFKFAWQVGFGLTVNLLNNISLDIGANYQSNFYQHDAMNTGFKYTAGFGVSLD